MWRINYPHDVMKKTLQLARSLFSVVVIALLLNIIGTSQAQQTPVDPQETSTSEATDLPKAGADDTETDKGDESTDESVAEDSPAAEKPDNATASGKPSIQTDIETLYLRDKDGELVPILNMTFEDFQRLYRLDKKLTQPQVPPSYTIERMDINGHAKKKDGQKVDLTIRLKVKLIKDGIAKIPLRLQSAILSQPAVYSGNGEHYLSSAGPKGGFVSWISGTAGSTHEIKLQMLAPTVTVGKQSQLNLSLPRASASKLIMNVPKGGTVSIANSGKLVKNGARERTPKRDCTVHTVRGLGDEFQMTWGVAGEKPPSSILIEATGDIEVTVTGPGVVSTLARFRITGIGGDLESVKIQLPPNSKPILVDDPSYVTEIASTGQDQNGTGSPIALVRFTEPTRGPIDVELSVEQTKPLIASETDQAMDVMGFRVLDAISHSGSVSLNADGDWLVQWEENTGLRRITGGANTAASANVIAVFEYYRQPATLPIQIYQNPTKINLEPLYVVDVQANQATLDAILKFRVRGTPASFVECDLSGWQVTSVGDASLVSEDAIRMNEVAPLNIPLASAKRGDFTMRLQAVKKLELPNNDEPENSTLLKLQLPGFKNMNVAPAVVVVNPADNLTLIGNATTNAFDSEPVPANLSVTPRDRPPLCYLYRGDPNSAMLEYKMVRREQSINVDIDNSLEVKSNYARVTQKFDYFVRYEALEQVRLDLPPALAEIASLRILLDDQEVDLDALRKSSFAVQAEDEPAPEAKPLNKSTGATDILPLPSERGKVAEEQSLRWDIPLPQPKSENIKVELSYDIPGELAQRNVDANDSTDDRIWSCYFAAPAEGNQRRVTFAVNTPDKLVAELTDTRSWTTSTNGTQAADSLNVAAKTQPQTADVRVRRVDAERSQSIVIERAFTQTWLGKSQRQDRTTLLLGAAESPLLVQLPRGADSNAAYVLINGQPAIHNDAGNATLSIELPPDIGDKLRLEVGYPFKNRSSIGPMRMEMPALNDAGWIRELYWQVVTPADEHLIWSSDRFALNNRWQLEGLGWQRQPEFSQSELEEWGGATKQLQPPTDTNTYLFGGFGERASLELRTASRRFLLLAGAIAALCAFFLWQFATETVRKFAVLPLFLTVVVAAALNLGLAVLLCEAAAIGFALIGMARLIQWILPSSRFTRYSPPAPSQLSVSHSQSVTQLSDRATGPRSTDSYQVTVPTAE